MNLIVRPSRNIKHFIELSSLQILNFSDRKQLKITKREPDLSPSIEIESENVTKFATLLNVSLTIANRMLAKHPELSQFPFTSIEKRAQFLVEKNVSQETVQKIPWILQFQSQLVESRSEEICEFLHLSEMSTALPFFKMHMRKIKEAGIKWKYENFETKSQFQHRLYFLSENLNCHPDTVAHMMSRATNLMIISEERILRMIQLVKEAEMSKTRVISDPYFLVQNVDVAEGRVRTAHDEGISHIRPWYLRTGITHFDRLVDREGRKERILKGKSLRDFFLKSLDIKESEFLLLKLRVPTLRKLSVLKLNQMVEFLISEGFTKEEIRQTPSVLAYSVKTLEQKIADLKQVGILPTLKNLNISSKAHETLLRKTKRFRVE